MVESIKKHIVYYSSESDFSDEELELNLECMSEHAKYSYSHCPVWKHRFDRTFIGTSPVNCSLIFEPRKNIEKEIVDYFIHYRIDDEEDSIDLSSYSDENPDPYISFSVSDIFQDNPVVQLSIQNYHFWTDFIEKDIWFEYLDHPLTSLKNNFIAIGGWFNISNHSRTTSLAIKVLDIEKPVVINKGDPIFRVRFFSDNLNDKFKLIKSKTPEGHFKIYDEKMKIFEEDKKLLNSTLFGKSECPFHKYNKS